VVGCRAEDARRSAEWSGQVLVEGVRDVRHAGFQLQPLESIARADDEGGVVERRIDVRDGGCELAHQLAPDLVLEGAHASSCGLMTAVMPVCAMS
jgi:hypothetical protein